MDRRGKDGHGYEGGMPGIDRMGKAGHG